MSLVTLIHGDTYGPITARLVGAASLGGATVTAQLHDPQSGERIDAPCTVTNAATGAIAIPGTERLTWPAGTYAVRFRVVYANTEVDIFPTVAPFPTVAVLPAFPPVTP
jgi:hypothetical protein